MNFSPFVTLFTKRWPLFLVLLVFLCLKFPHLSSPFYWDESWPYASGVYTMYQNGPSLMPGTIPGELARGHPLLFHYFASLWLKIFGTSIFTLHTYPLFVSMLILISVFEISLRLFNLRTATLALIFLAFQQIFFVQSSFVLLELQLAFFALLGLYFYSVRNFLGTIIALTCLFYTKESGAVLGAVLGIDAFVLFWIGNESRRVKLLCLVSVAVPVVFFLLFFVVQKRISGWYVLPLYSQGFEQHWMPFYDKFRAGFKVVFKDDYRNYWFFILSALSFFVALKTKQYKYLLLTFLGVIITLMVLDKLNHLFPAFFLFALFFVVFLALMKQLNKITLPISANGFRFIRLTLVFVVAFFLFTAYNLFFIDRYLLVAIVPMLLVAAYYFDQLTQSTAPKLFIPALTLTVLIQAWTFYRSEGLGDNKLGAFDGAALHQSIVDYTENNFDKNVPIAAGGYLNRIHLTDPNTKFLSGVDTFSTVTWEIMANTQLVIFDNIEPDNRYESIANDSANWMLEKRIDRGSAWAELYKRR